MMKFRVVLPDGNVRKLECEPSSVKELYDAIKERFCDIPQVFIIHHFDSEFSDYFSLEHDGDIRDLMTLKIVLPVNSSAGAEGGPSSSSNSSTAEPDSEAPELSPSLSSRKKSIRSSYNLPRFDADLEMMLQKADGTVPCSHGEKSRILTRLCADIFENYTAYPSSSDLEIVAMALVEKYPGVKDTGKGYEAWTNSLMFKMGNYRSDMRKRGSLEMSMNSGKRSKYHPELPSARKGYKKAKCGVINWQPEYPDGEDDNSLQQHKMDIRSEIQKGSADQNLIKKKMSLTFALRRKEINSNVRISDVKDNWPALFDMKEMDGAQVLPTKRDAVLKSVALFLGCNIDLLCRDSQDDDSEEQSGSPFIVCASDASYDINIEGCTVLANISSFTDSLLALFMCHYILNLEYNKRLKNFYMFLQVWLVGIAERVVPPKLMSFFNQLQRSSN